MRALVIIFTFAFLAVGCAKTSHGPCDAPNEHLTWFYKAETVHPFDHDYCVYCDTSVEDAELASWAESMDAPVPGGSSSDLTPCLYVYSTDDNATDTAASCKAMVCGDDPNTNDVVGAHHGVWKHLEPILHPVAYTDTLDESPAFDGVESGSAPELEHVDAPAPGSVVTEFVFATDELVLDAPALERNAGM